ncbi:MAG: sigma-70 family RNA polymerase sigma factor [Actinomycetota bacterium]
MTTSDRRLVERARYGDADAVAEIYGRYGDRVFGLCLTLLRDRDAAADATQDTFLAAWERIEQLRDPDKLRPWLFAIARNRVIGRSRADAKATPSEEVFEVAVDDQTADALHAAALGRLMWDAAEGLEERDRLLLELSVRQGLEGSELAEAMGIPPARAYTLTNRVKGRIERALGALLVARLGRDDCDDLGTLLDGWDGRFDVAVRRRVVRHVDDCALCSERRATLVAPASLFGALPVIGVPAALRDGVLTGYSLGTSPSTPSLMEDWSDDGWPPTAGSERGAIAAELAMAEVAVPVAGVAAGASDVDADRTSPRRGLLTLAAAAVVALVIGAAAVLAGGGDDGDTAAAQRIAAEENELAEPEPIVASSSEPGGPTTVGPVSEVAAEEASVPTDSPTSDADETIPAVEGSVIAPTSAPAAAPPASSAPPVAAPPTIQPTSPTIVPEPTVTIGTTTTIELTTTTSLDDVTTTTPPDGTPDPTAPDPTDPDTAPTTTTEPQGGALSVSPGTLTVNPDDVSSFRISNAGPGTVSWSASPSVGFGVSPASGRLGPGGAATVTVTVGSRASSGTVTINGGVAAVTVNISVLTGPTTTLGLTAPTAPEADGRATIDDDDFGIIIAPG